MIKGAAVIPALALLAACGGPGIPPELTPMRQKQTAAQPSQGQKEGTYTTVGGRSVRSNNPVRYAGAVKGQRATVLAALRAANEGARRNTLDGYFDGAELILEWESGRVFDVVLAKDKISNIKLWPGEGYINHAFGNDLWLGLDATWEGTTDRRAAQAGPARTVIPIVAYERGKCTDVSLYTTHRTILLNACSNGTSDAWNREVSWVYPEDEQRAQQAAMSFNPTPMDNHTGLPIDQLDGRYRFKGSKDFQPERWTAVNDRKDTYLIPPSNLGFLPAPFVVGKSGGETAQYEIIPSREEGRSIIKVDGVPQAIALQHGGEVMMVNRGSGR